MLYCVLNTWKTKVALTNNMYLRGYNNPIHPMLAVGGVPMTHTHHISANTDCGILPSTLPSAVSSICSSVKAGKGNMSISEPIANTAATAVWVNYIKQSGRRMWVPVWHKAHSPICLPLSAKYTNGGWNDLLNLHTQSHSYYTQKYSEIHQSGLGEARNMMFNEC